MFCVNIIRFQGGFGRWNLMLTINNTFSRRDIAFTSDFCNNHSHPVSPASMYLTSLRPRPTRPRVPYLMSSSPSSRVPTSQVPTHASRCPCPLVPVPLLYTASVISLSTNKTVITYLGIPSSKRNVLNIRFLRTSGLQGCK